MNDWLEIIITVNIKHLAETEAVAVMAAKGGIYTEDYSSLEEEVEEIAHIDLIDEELLQKDRELARIHMFVSPEDEPQGVLMYLQEHLPDAEISTGNVSEEDWANNWKHYYKPFPVGERLYVRPQWEEPDDRATGRETLILDPGMAFGSGTHETTRLCLEMMENCVTEETELLDVGCGSGILAIAGMKLGAKRAVAVDIDALAVKVAGENAEINGVGGNIEFICGDLAERVTGKYELITANIVADVIIRLTKNIMSYLKDDGIFVASGIIDSRENEVVEAVRACGLKVIKIAHDKGWVALTAVKGRAEQQ